MNMNSKQLGLSNNDNQIQINNNYLSLTYNHNHGHQQKHQHQHQKREQSMTRSFISHSGSSETSDAESDRSDISITAEMNEMEDGNIVYQLLTKQRNEAIDYSQRLESRLAENDLQFAVKLDQFKQQLKQYKNTNQYLKTQNVSLKREIQKLKDKLKASELYQHKGFDELLKKRKKINSNKSKKLPNYIRKDFKQQEIVVPDKIAAEKRKDMTQRLNELRFISEQQQKQKHVQQQHGHYQQYQIQIQDMDEEREKEEQRERELENERDERPFIKHGRSPTESTEGSSESSLSACAVNLSFPSIKTPLTHHRQLTTILEHKSIPQTMLELIANSDDDVDINNEWRKTSTSMTNDDIDDQNEYEHQNENDNDNDNVDHIPNIPQMMDHIGIEQISMDKRQRSVDTDRTETTAIHSESMSYMSNNTNMLKEIASMNTIDELPIDDQNEGIMDDNDQDEDDDDEDEDEEEEHEEHKNEDNNSHNHHDKTATMIINNINLNNDFEHDQKLSNYSANYCKHDLDEHDQIITSPIKISANQSFKVRL